MAQTTPRGAALAFFESIVAANERSHECIIWPFARNGNGYAVFGKKRGAIASALVSRVVCAEVHGMPFDLSYEASHKCGNGHSGCINPQHLEWKTSKANKADQLTHGTRNRGERNGSSRLTSEQVSQIRRLCGSVSQREIARMFSIDQSTISNISRRKRWEHIQ